MCLTIPKKVLKIKGNSVVVENYDGARQELKTLIELNVGDFVLSQQNIIVERIDKEHAKEILNLLNQEDKETL